MGIKYEKKRKIISSIAVVLCTVLALPLTQAYAAGAVDTGKACRLTISTSAPVPGYESYTDDLGSAKEITAKLYRVASIDESGSYTASAGLEGLGLETIGSGPESGPTAEAMVDMARRTAVKLGLLPGEDGKPAANTAVADKELTFTGAGGSGIAENLMTGLYLVWVDPADTKNYEYTFSPYLISLPNNTYYTDGNDGWIYDVTVGLKPERESRFGKLEIVKTLDSYNASLGTASFVFQVVAVRDGETVYSNMVSLSFSDVGKKSVILDQIPAGSEVTVTEVYSGSAYRITEGADGYTIPADAFVAAGEGDAPKSVSFTNTYDDSGNHGTGIVNHFEYDGEGFKFGGQRPDNS